MGLATGVDFSNERPHRLACDDVRRNSEPLASTTSIALTIAQQKLDIAAIL